jgi:hypothetical protein
MVTQTHESKVKCCSPFQGHLKCFVFISFEMSIFTDGGASWPATLMNGADRNRLDRSKPHALRNSAHFATLSQSRLKIRSCHLKHLSTIMDSRPFPDRSPTVLLNICTSEVNELRRQLVQVHRRLTLAPLLHSAGFQFAVKKFTDNFHDYVFKPVELQSFPGLAQLIKNSGFLLSYAREHPQLLGKAVLNRVKSSSAPYLWPRRS